MKPKPAVLCAGIIVADHVCHPVTHVPAAGELVMADKMLLTIGGCAANAAGDLVKMDLSAPGVRPGGSAVLGRVVAHLLRRHRVHSAGPKISPAAAPRPPPLRTL